MRPACLPFLKARCNPARVLSRIVSRSYSANDASIWKMRLPLGLEVSMGSVALIRPRRRPVAYRGRQRCELRLYGVLRSSVALMAVSILRSVLFKHAAYILHQFIELSHLFLTELLDAFVLYARYDLISYPPDLPSSFREADDLGPSIGRVRHPLHVTRCFKLVDGVEQGLLGGVRVLGQFGQAKSSLSKVVKNVSAPGRVAVSETGGGQLSVYPHE